MLEFHLEDLFFSRTNEVPHSSPRISFIWHLFFVNCPEAIYRMIRDLGRINLNSCYHFSIK